ncbi:hypothetical protein Tco_0121821 [Tanacetum coccineum]
MTGDSIVRNKTLTQVLSSSLINPCGGIYSVHIVYVLSLHIKGRTDTLHLDIPSDTLTWRVPHIRHAYQMSGQPHETSSSGRDEEVIVFQQTLDGPARGWFDRMPNGYINSWAELCEKFVEISALRRRCSKDPTEVSKIVRRANETLPDFKEDWTEEIRRFADQVPQKVTEMMKRVDDFVKSEEAYRSIEFPKEEHPEKGQGTPYRGPRPPRIMQSGGPPKVDGYKTYNRRDHYQPYTKGNTGYRTLAPTTSLPSNDQNAKEGELGQILRLPWRKWALHQRLLLVKEIVGSCLRIWKAQPSSQRREAKWSNRGKQIKNSNANGKIYNMVYEKGDSRKRKSGTLSYPESICGSRRSSASDVQTLFPQPVPDYSSMFNANPYGISGVLCETVTSNRKNQVGRCADAIFECRQLEGKQVLPEEQPKEGTVKIRESSTEEDVMINLAFPNQKVTIRIQFSLACRLHLINLLKDNKDVFAWQPTDTVRVPRRISQHSFNVNSSVTPVAQKQRVLGPKKSKAVMKEVEEWIKAGIVRPVRYPT